MEDNEGSKREKGGHDFHSRNQTKEVLQELVNLLWWVDDACEYIRNSNVFTLDACCQKWCDPHAQEIMRTLKSILDRILLQLLSKSSIMRLRSWWNSSGGVGFAMYI